jgi:hypothetical protein
LTPFSSNKIDERTEVLYGSENVMNAISQFLSKANTIHSCGEYKAPSAIVKVEEYRKLLFDLKKRGIKLRYVTDITKDNVKYCKELMSEFAYEIRHLDGIKANFSFVIPYWYIITILIACVFYYYAFKRSTQR